MEGSVDLRGWLCTERERERELYLPQNNTNTVMQRATEKWQCGRLPEEAIAHQAGHLTKSTNKTK